MSSARNTLDEILMMISSFRGDKEKLLRLFDYIHDNLYNPPKPVDIPKKYKNIVHDVAEMLPGNVCYINPETLEMVYFPDIEDLNLMDMEEMEENILEVEADAKDDDDIMEKLDLDDDVRWQYAEYLKMRKWKKHVEIGPPRSRISYEMMEGFVNAFPASRLKEALFEAIHKQKPFRHFNAIIHQSTARQQWFDWRQRQMEIYVWEQLSSELKEMNGEDD